MKYLPVSIAMLSLVIVSSDALGVGRGGGGGGRGGGGGGGGRSGGGARPAPSPAARPAPQRPSMPSRPAGPSGPSIDRNGAIGKRPDSGGNRPDGPGHGGIGPIGKGDGKLGPLGKGDGKLGPIGKGDGKLGPIGKGDGKFDGKGDWRPGGHGTDGGLANLSKQWNQVKGGNHINHIDKNTINNIGNRVRNNYTNVNVFNNNWYGRHPGAWRPFGWAGAGAFWATATWGAWWAFGGYPATAPVYYDYGSNIVYEGDTVYVNGDAAGTPTQYAQQAATLADTGRQAESTPKEEWMSLGVFAMVQGEDRDSNNLFQLAVSKAGVIRGNFYNQLTDATLPVYGSVDPKTQRAAWTVGDKKDIVYEAGAANLTQDQTTMLVHLGKDQTQQWTLVRLQQPAGQ